MGVRRWFARPCRLRQFVLNLGAVAADHAVVTSLFYCADTKVRRRDAIVEPDRLLASSRQARSRPTFKVPPTSRHEPRGASGLLLWVYRLVA